MRGWSTCTYMYIDMRTEIIQWEHTVAWYMHVHVHVHVKKRVSILQALVNFHVTISQDLKVQSNKKEGSTHTCTYIHNAYTCTLYMCTTNDRRSACQCIHLELALRFVIHVPITYIYLRTFTTALSSFSLICCTDRVEDRSWLTKGDLVWTKFKWDVFCVS